VLAHQPLDRRHARRGAQLAHQRADRLAELDRSACLVSVPERHLAGLARRR
jgi:hypothetical protein